MQSGMISPVSSPKLLWAGVQGGFPIWGAIVSCAAYKVNKAQWLIRLGNTSAN